MAMIRFPKRLLGLAALAAVLGGCEATTEAPRPASVLLTFPRDTAIRAGLSFQVRTTVLDQLGNILTGRNVFFLSITPDRATVTTDGLVTAVAPGPAMVEAILAELRDTLRFQVLDARIVRRIQLAGAPYGSAVSANGAALVTRLTQRSVQRLDLATQSFTDSIPVFDAPTQVTFNADGSRAYVSNQLSRSISVINVATALPIATLPTTGDPVPMQVNAAGNAIFYTTNVNRLYRAELPSGTVTDSLALPATASHLLLHPANQLLYVATRAGGSVLEVDVNTMSVVRTFTTGGFSQALAIAPDLSELYVANEAGWLDIINLTTGTLASPIPMGGGAFGLTLGPDGSRLYVGLPATGLVRVVDRVSRATLATIVTGGRPREFAVDPATQVVIVANEAGWVDLVY